MAIAVRGLTHSASSVLEDTFCSTDARISHVLASTVLADLEHRVTVELCKIRRRDTTLAMQTIKVLTSDILQMVPIHKLNQGHVRLRRVSLHE